MLATDLAYAAGIIDGEGSIQIQRHRRSDYYVGYHYAMNVQVQMVWDIHSVKGIISHWFYFKLKLF